MNPAEWFDLGAYPEWQLILVGLVLLGLFAVLYRIMTDMLIRRIDDLFLSVLLRELYLPIVATAITIAVTLVTELMEPGTVRFTLRAAVFTVLLLLWSYAIIRISNRLAKTRDRERVKFAPVLANIFTFVVILAAFFLLLGIWGLNVTPLLASAGIIGIILGYAARDTISNLAAGVSLYFDRTFIVGDFISLPSGERGTVVDISIRSTTILTRDYLTINIPNAEFNRQYVLNESSPQRHRRLRLDVGVAYGSDLEAVDKALVAAAAEVRMVIDDPEPEVKFREFADSAILVQLQVYIDHPANRGRAIDQLIREIDSQFKAHDIKIPFPQRELTFFESGNTLRVEDTHLNNRD